MNEDGSLNQSGQDSSGTQPSKTDQALHHATDPDNSFGSVYHSTVQMILEQTEQLPIQTLASPASESDSDQHFSDAVQESDNSSVYSAEESFPAAEESENGWEVGGSHHQWSPSASKVSVVKKHSSAEFTSKIPRAPQMGNSLSTGSLQFHLTIEKARGSGSLIPVPTRFFVPPGHLESETKMASRSPSPDKDALSSESENITAISVKTLNNDGGLEKYKSDELLGEPVTFPLDTPEVKPDNLRQTIVDYFQSYDDDITAPQDSDVSKFTLTDCTTHLYESDHDESGPRKNKTEVVTEVKFSAQPYTSDNEDFSERDETSTSARAQIPEDGKIILETIQIVEFDRLQREECMPAPKIDYLQILDDPTAHMSSSIAYLASNVQSEQMVEAPEKKVEAPEQVVEAPEEMVEAPEQVVETPEEMVEAPEPVVEAPEQVEVAPEQVVESDEQTLIALDQTEATPDQLIVPSDLTAIEEVSTTNDSSLIVLTSTSTPSCVDGSESNSEDQINDEDYVEIEEEPSRKKLTRFEKFKSKLSGRSSNKEAKIKSGSSTKTLKIKRKPPKSPGSRPSSAKNFICSPVKKSNTILRPKGNAIPQSNIGSIRATIKREPEQMNQDNQELSVKKRSNSDIAIGQRIEPFVELKESSTHSVQDSTLHDTKSIKSPSSSSVKTAQATGESNAVSVPKILSPVNQSKLNNFISRYRVQLKKLNNQVSDLTELQNKTRLSKESLTLLKSQIMELAGVMPSYLNDIPSVPVLTYSSTLGSSDTELVSSAYEDLLAETETLKADKARMALSINNMTKDARILKDDNANLTESLNLAKKQIITEHKAYEEKFAQIEALKEEAAKAKRLLETFRRKNEILAKTINETKVMQDEEKSRRVQHEKTLVAEIHTLKNELITVTSKRESSKQILAQMTDDKKNLEVQVVSLNHTIKELQKNLIEQEKEVNKVKDIQQEYSALKEAFHDVEKELIESKKICQSLVSRIESSKRAEEETSKKLIELSGEVMNKTKIIERHSEKNQIEEKKRSELFKIISDLSTFTGGRIGPEEIQKAAEKGNGELTNPIVKILEELEGVLNAKNVEIVRLKQTVTDLENLHQEKQSLIEQLHEFINEKNAKICRRSESRVISDNQEGEKTIEKASNLSTPEGQNSLKDHPDFQDLYKILEVKRHTLIRMESQIRRLQEVHAYCGIRRTMQESRIAELETMLAHCLH